MGMHLGTREQREGRHRPSWPLVRAQLAALDHTKWAPAPQDNSVDDAEHERRWVQALQAQREIHALTLGDWREAPAAAQVLLYGYRYTRQLALASRTIRRGQLLQHIQPANWYRDLQLPSNLYDGPAPLTPEADPPAFERLFAATHHLLRATPNTPASHLAEFYALPNNIRLAWPEPADLLMFEEGMVDHLTSLVEDRGQVRAAAYARRVWGLGQVEAQEWVDAVLDHYRHVGQVDQEIQRGLMIARAEKFYARTKKGRNLREEGQALKLLANLLGLSRGEVEEPDKGKSDLLTTIKKIAQSDPLPLPSAPVDNATRALPAPSKETA